MQAILETVADEVAVNTGMLVKRKRKLTGSALAQILVLGCVGKPRGEFISTSLKPLSRHWVYKSADKLLSNV